MRRRIALLFVLAIPGLAFADSASNGSLTSKVIQGLFQGCWVCGTFNTISAIGLTFANSIFSQLASSMTLLIGLFMGLWLLFFAAKLFLPVGGAGAAHWNAGAMKLFKLMFVLAFLQSSTLFWNYIFIPLISAGMGIASQMVSATDSFETNWGGKSEPVPGSGPDYCTAPPPLPQVSGMDDVATQAVQAMAQMDCPLSRMQSQFAKGILVGVAVVEQVGCPSSNILASLYVSFQDLSYIFAGVILIGAYLFGFLVYPLLLIDVIMRVIFVVATSPISIAAVLYKPTSRFAERGLWTLGHCSLTMIFGAVVCGIGKATLAYVFSTLTSSSGSAPMSTWSNLENAVENSCSSGFSFGILSANFYILLATAIMLIFMTRRASSMAAELTNVSGSTGAQAAMASMVGRAGEMTGRAAKSLFKKGRSEGNNSRAAKVTGNEKE